MRPSRYRYFNNIEPNAGFKDLYDGHRRFSRSGRVDIMSSTRLVSDGDHRKLGIFQEAFKINGYIHRVNEKAVMIKR